MELSDITLRPAEQEDANFLWDLHVTALKPHVSAVYGWDEAFQRSYYLENYSTLHNQVIQYQSVDVGVLAVEETLLGYILSSIELLPSYQGIGIGTTLITELLERAAARGLPVSLRTLKNTPARPLYERLGFQIIGETEVHYWMRKEGRPVQYLPSRWETNLCFMVEADDQATGTVAMILGENTEALEISGKPGNPQEQAQREVSHAVLPPGGVPWRERLYLIRDIESRDTIGFLNVYFGYPTPETIYISSLYMRPAWQGRGFGQVIVAELARLVLQAGFHDARVVVGLKNWRALRFWTRCGFSRIMHIRGNQTNPGAPQGNVELLKALETRNG
ncbi:MAG: GNAT family N-acetyltransferase [Bellilinea sp.]